MKTISFDGWKLMGALPWQPDFSRWMQQGELQPGQGSWIDGQVPGSVYADLWRAGQIEDPYFGCNSLACEWVANRWWIYRTTFSLTLPDLEDTLLLTFHGIDYAAKIYVNGELAGKHEGMYLPFQTQINAMARAGTNVLVCVLEHAPFCAPQPGYTSQTRYMKARFNYKWDFSARLVNLGLYDKVTLTAHPLASVSSAFLRPVRGENGWELSVSLELDAYRAGDVRLQYALFPPSSGAEDEPLLSGEQTLALAKGRQEWKLVLPVEQPSLWWPNGYGGQPLYSFAVRLWDKTKLSDRKSWRVGFRTLSYFHADGREDALPYGVCINGRKIYLKGTNLVPFDCMTGTVTEERLRSQLATAREANINFFRIWGGGHIQSEAFYNLCDEMGFLVLQEFPMSSSGCDDVPSRDPQFLKLLEQVARYQIPLKRNHPSLVFWDGGNELTDFHYLGQPDHEGHPATFEDPTLAMLKGLVEELHPGVQMLPSSGSGPNALLHVDQPGQNHDVHGPWGYLGVRRHYAFYNQSDSIVHGEFGCGGISNLDSLRRFLPEGDQALFTAGENPVWAHHSGGWDSYAFRERLMFGDLKHLPLEDYIRVNQFVQAESLRYSLESNRRRQWKNVGQMTWQYNEPWPNVQCSNIVDYYGGKKLAWYFLQEAYAPVLASLRYHSLFYAPGDAFSATLFLQSDLPDGDYTLLYTVTDSQGNPLMEEPQGPLLRCCESGYIHTDEVISLGEIAFILPKQISGSFSIRLHVECGGFSTEKEYLFLIAGQTIPLRLSPMEREQLRAMDPKRLANGLDAKRASVRPVIEFVKRYRALKEGSGSAAGQTEGGSGANV